MPARLCLLFHPTDMCCAPTLFQKLFQALEWQQSRQTQSLPSWSWHSWRACRVHGADTRTKRLTDDAREWNWVTCYDRGNGSGACFSEQWHLSWHLKNEKVLAFQSSGRKQTPGNRDKGYRGPDTGLSQHSKWPLFSVNYTDQTVVYSIPKPASLILLHFIQSGNNYWCFPGGSVVKNLPAMQETQILSLDEEDPPGGSHGNPLQYSCLENPLDRGAWWATVHRVARSWTRLKWLSMHKHLLCRAK